MNTMYLTLMTGISDQAMSDSTPYTVGTSGRSPYSGLKHRETRRGARADVAVDDTERGQREREQMSAARLPPAAGRTSGQRIRDGTGGDRNALLERRSNDVIIGEPPHDGNGPSDG